MHDKVKEEEASKLCSKCGKKTGEFKPGKDSDFVVNTQTCSCSNESNNSPAVELKENSFPNLGTRYTVDSILGQGGMGTVYKVFDSDLKKHFAVKVLRKELAQDPSAVKRFIQEAESQGDLVHPNIVSLLGSEKTASGEPYLIMDYIEGKSLAEILKGTDGLEPKRALNIFLQVSNGLSYAHRHNLIHRDLKPSNIIVSTKSEVESVYLVDFGIAKIQESEFRQTQNLTQTGDVIGSPEYMSPEQCLNIQVDTRSDIYSFGCVMYETLTGSTPFSGANAIQIIAKHLNNLPLSIEDHPHIKSIPNLEAIISTCLEKDPESRYKDVDALINDLKSVNDGKNPIVAHRINLIKKSKPIFPVLASILALVSWAVLGYTTYDYVQRVQENVRAKSIITNANTLTKRFSDAGVALGGYSISKSPLFSDRFDAIVRGLPDDLEKLYDLAGYNNGQRQIMEEIQRDTIAGLKVLGEAKAAIDDNELDAVQNRSPEIYRQIRAIADRMQKDFRNLTQEARLIEQKPQPSFWNLVWVGIASLILNIIAFLSILRFKRSNKD